MNAICDTTAKSETLSVKGCKVKITYHGPHRKGRHDP